MVTLAFVVFALVAAVLGGVMGFLGHFARAHLRFPPEELDLGQAYDLLARDDYQFEKHVVGAQWDDNGYWDAGSNRNLIYYVLSGAAAPLLLAIIFFGERDMLVRNACEALFAIGLSSPLCTIT